MISGWKEKPLDEFVALQRGFDLPQGKRRPGPFQVLTSGQTNGWHDEGPVKGPGFVIGRATNLGRPTWSDDDFWPLNTTLYVKDFLGNDPKFAFYWFQNEDLSAYNSGSVQAMLNRNYIAKIAVLVPPVAEQRRIADALRSLDDKINSNLRIITSQLELLTLEFQRLLDVNDKEYVPLQAVAELTKGVSYRSVDLKPSDTSLVTLKSIDRNGGYKADGLKQYIGPYKPAQVVMPSDIVVAQTDLTQGAEVVGRAVRVPSSNGARRLVASLDLVIVRPKGEVSNEYLLGVLTQESFRQHCRNRTNGTTVLHLASDAIPSYIAPIVGPEARETFSKYASTVHASVDSLSLENVTLTALRDTLLPELLSGRIRVGEEAL